MYSGVAAVRPLRASDAVDVLAAFQSSDDMHRQGTVTNLDEAHAYVAGQLDESHRAFAITDDDRLVGLVGLSIDHGNRLGWFWYWMNTSHRGRGWVSDAATFVANWALDGGGCERLELGHRANNAASGRVAVAAGFVLEGRERGKFLVDGERIDVLTYGRLATDPWPSSPDIGFTAAPRGTSPVVGHS